VRVCAWSFALMAALAVYVPAYVAAVRPPEGAAADFLQEWLSARHFASGGPVYAPQHETAPIHLGLTPEEAAEIHPWNAHPPVSVLLVIPLGRLDYRDAHFAWNLLGIPLFLLSVVVLVREMRLPFQMLSWLPAVTLALACYPLYYQFNQGNLTHVLLALVTLGWAADRRGWGVGAGVCLGTAAAVKLFPAFLFVYLLAARRWRAAAVGAVTFTVLHLIAVAVFGTDSFRTYWNEVLPSTAHYQSNRQNAALTGLWLRLFDPHPVEHVIPLAPNPTAATTLSILTRLAVIGAVAWVARRSNSGGDRDRAFALALVGMLLLTPVTWAHYFLLLGLPLGLAWLRLRSWFARRFLGMVIVVLWLPTYYLPVVFGGGGHTVPDYLLARSPLTPVENLALASLPNYALLLLFLLVACVPVRVGDQLAFRHLPTPPHRNGRKREPHFGKHLAH
jgi:hypothetical protein